jgi:hypothetical protein
MKGVWELHGTVVPVHEGLRSRYLRLEVSSTTPVMVGPAYL